MNQQSVVGGGYASEGAAAGGEAAAPGKGRIERGRPQEPAQKFETCLRMLRAHLRGIRDRFVPALQAGTDEPGLASNLRWAVMQLDLETDRARQQASALGEDALAQIAALEPEVAQAKELAAPWLDAAPKPVQRRARGTAPPDDVHAHAQAGIAGTGGALPHADAIQASFGPHDVSGIRAHVGGPAASASAAIGAEAYAIGNDVAFAESPSLFVAAHEAAHVVQQRAGVSLLGGIGESGDTYEQHADAVAERVVRGESAAGLLGEVRGGSSLDAVQRSGTGERCNDDGVKYDHAAYVRLLLRLSAEVGEVTRSNADAISHGSGKASQRKRRANAVLETGARAMARYFDHVVQRLIDGSSVDQNALEKSADIAVGECLALLGKMKAGKLAPAKEALTASLESVISQLRARAGWEPGNASDLIETADLTDVEVRLGHTDDELALARQGFASARARIAALVKQETADPETPEAHAVAHDIDLSVDLIDWEAGETSSLRLDFSAEVESTSRSIGTLEQWARLKHVPRRGGMAAVFGAESRMRAAVGMKDEDRELLERTDGTDELSAFDSLGTGECSEPFTSKDSAINAIKDKFVALFDDQHRGHDAANLALHEPEKPKDVSAVDQLIEIGISMLISSAAGFVGTVTSQGLKEVMKRSTVAASSRKAVSDAFGQIGLDPGAAVVDGIKDGVKDLFKQGAKKALSLLEPPKATVGWMPLHYYLTGAAAAIDKTRRFALDDFEHLRPHLEQLDLSVLNDMNSRLCDTTLHQEVEAKQLETTIVEWANFLAKLQYGETGDRGADIVNASASRLDGVLVVWLGLNQADPHQLTLRDLTMHGVQDAVIDMLRSGTSDHPKVGASDEDKAKQAKQVDRTIGPTQLNKIYMIKIQGDGSSPIARANQDPDGGQISLRNDPEGLRVLEFYRRGEPISQRDLIDLEQGWGAYEGEIAVADVQASAEQIVADAADLPMSSLRKD